MPAIHIIFKGWYSLIPEISHCYSTHPPQLYSPYSWNFRIVIPLSATIIQPIFLKFSHCYSTLCHNYTTHIPELFALLFHISATIIQPIILNFSHCYSTCPPQPYHTMSWDNWPPMPHLFHTFTQTNTNNIPAVFPQYSNPYSNPTCHPPTGESGCDSKMRPGLQTLQCI